MKKLLLLLKPYRKALITVAVTDAIGMLMGLFMPYVMSVIVDRGIAEGDLAVILGSAALMLALALLSVGSCLIANKINTRVTSGYTRDVCRATFEKINSLSYGDYSRLGPSGLLTRATDDIFNIEGAASSLVYTLVTVPVMLVGSAVLSFIADPVLSLVFILGILPVVVVIFFFTKPLYAMWDKSDHYVDEQNKIVRERLSGLRVVRAFNNEAREHKRARFATEEMAKYMIRANVRGGFVDPLAMLLLNIAMVAMIFVAGERAAVGVLAHAGDIVAVVQYVAIISGALLNLSWTIAWLPRLRVSIKRINEIHAMPAEDNTALVAREGGYDIDVRDLTFTYPDGSEPVLKNISLSVKEGERVAIIGGTGSGKTTLVRLLLSFFSATSGEIFIGGRAYSSLTRGEIRAHFSPALQRAMLFEGTLRDNVRMGSGEADDEKILSALSDCAMEEFVTSHEEGLDYLIVGMGRNVSGGQRQRINMARVIIREADVYIFDDSFSALDFLTESVIKEKLSERLRGKTEITVTQRVSTAMRAERIYVMDGGGIVGVGSHSELIRTSPIYREICASQLGADSVGGDING